MDGCAWCDTSDEHRWCKERHLDSTIISALETEGTDRHNQFHAGPWKFCADSLCKAIREVVGL